jgi:hypothetical protein
LVLTFLALFSNRIKSESIIRGVNLRLLNF